MTFDLEVSDLKHLSEIIDAAQSEPAGEQGRARGGIGRGLSQRPARRAFWRRKPRPRRASRRRDPFLRRVRRRAPHISPARIRRRFGETGSSADLRSCGGRLAPSPSRRRATSISSDPAASITTTLAGRQHGVSSCAGVSLARLTSLARMRMRGVSRIWPAATARSALAGERSVEQAIMRIGGHVRGGSPPPLATQPHGESGSLCKSASAPAMTTCPFSMSTT